MYVDNLYPEWVHKLSVTHPLSIIASDSGEPGGHPRTAGTFGKLLGDFVRQRHWLSLMESLRKVTIQPAQRLESFVPAMRERGRLRVGAVADVTIFHPETVINRATYRAQALPTTGVPYVIVNGTIVVRDSSIVEGVLPGQSIRAPRR